MTINYVKKEKVINNKLTLLEKKKLRIERLSLELEALKSEVTKYLGQKIGYARVSTGTKQQENSLENQCEKLREHGCVKIFEEQYSANERIKIPGKKNKVASTIESREELMKCLAYLKEGDTLVIPKIDRLARSLKQLMQIKDMLAVRGVDIFVLNMNLSINSEMGKWFFYFVGFFAEFESSIRSERQLEGIIYALDKGTESGKAMGRNFKLSKENQTELIQMFADGMSTSKIAKHFGICQLSVYRYLNQDYLDYGASVYSSGI